MDSRYRPSIDLVKITCALMIVFIHTSPLESCDVRLNSVLVNGLCRVAVPFFFISSGYLLFRKMRLDAVDFGRVGRYLRRMLFLYLVWSAVYFPYTAAQMHRCHDVRAAAAVFLGWLKDMVFSAGFGFLWYLPATIVAVLLVSLLLRAGLKIHTVIGIGVLLYVIGLAGQSYYGLFAKIPFPQGFVSAVRACYTVMGTTRNGVFEGMVFVALGAALSQKEALGSFRRAAFGFVLSAVLLVCEFALISKLGWRLDYDMYLSLLPCAYYLMRAALCANVRLDGGAAVLRSFGRLIYFTHMIPTTVLTEYLPVENSLLRTAAVLLVTLLLSAAIYAASRTKRFAFLQKIY